MPQANLSDLLQSIEQLPADEKLVLRAALDAQLGSPDQPTNGSTFGWAKGAVVIHPDFDEPLPELEEYSE